MSIRVSSSIFLSAFLHFGSVLSEVHDFRSAIFCWTFWSSFVSLSTMFCAACVQRSCDALPFLPQCTWKRSRTTWSRSRRSSTRIRTPAPPLPFRFAGGVAAGVVVVVAVVVDGGVGAGVPSANAAGMRASARTISARGAKRFIEASVWEQGVSDSHRVTVR